MAETTLKTNHDPDPEIHHQLLLSSELHVFMVLLTLLIRSEQIYSYACAVWSSNSQTVSVAVNEEELGLSQISLISEMPGNVPGIFFDARRIQWHQ